MIEFTTVNVLLAAGLSLLIAVIFNYTIKKELKGSSVVKKWERNKVMKESIQIALEVYLLGFAISILIAALIKGLMTVLQRFSTGK